MHKRPARPTTTAPRNAPAKAEMRPAASGSRAVLPSQLAAIQRTAGNQAAIRFLGGFRGQDARPRQAVVQRTLDPAATKAGDRIREDGGAVYTVDSVNEQAQSVVASLALGRPSSPPTVKFVAGSATDTYTAIAAPVTSPNEPTTSPSGTTGAVSSSNNTTWDALKRTHSIDKASPLLQPLQPVKTLGPGFPTTGSSSKGKARADGTAYVANILTIPSGRGIQPIIDAYATQGMTEAFWPHFSMVIGVNRFRSLDGSTIERLERAVATATGAVFPTAIVPFMWDFNWTAGFQAAQQAFRTLDTAEQRKALDYEKAQLVQSTIPYGALREFVTTHAWTRRFLEALAKTHEAVYIHLGDDDARSLRTKLGPLLEGYAGLDASKAHAPLIVGGYEFRAGEGGDLDPAMAQDVMTAVGSEIEIWFRTVLAGMDPDMVYPTEPNLAFLAAEGDHLGPYDALREPSGEEGKKLATDEKRARADEPELRGPDVEFTTGLLYGRNTNEGGKLRDRIRERTGAQPTPKGRGGPKKVTSPKRGGGAKKGGGETTIPTTTYQPNLAIATASTRFTIRDAEHIQHDRSERTYGERRAAAYAGAGSREEKVLAYKQRVLEDVLTVKQSHVGGLAKELAKHPTYNKQAKAIAQDVLAAVVALLSGQSYAAKAAASKPFVAAIEAGKGNIQGFNDRLDRAVGAMTEQYEESLTKATSEVQSGPGVANLGNSNGSGQSETKELVTQS